ncbi:hypothetical protein Pla163_37890 [Planctomycetes bacterium Pla163]|uniref:Peptidase C39-like domain-containing protein n=1 Tax=Rohdeia mirabilis TaxID=2528008 RepID=A0A518D591_9BACT|nr:hypothetical protein Pla163_37890 [Planctomycetes bacterium Pla163]
MPPSLPSGPDRRSAAKRTPSPPQQHDLADFEIRRQPDDTTCGPTCLHAVYRYFGDERPLGTIRDEVRTVEGGGTLGVHLGLHALARGYAATLVTWNINVFDPTWFGDSTTPPKPSPPKSLATKLRERAAALRLRPSPDLKLANACDAYVEFVETGGKIVFQDLDAALLRRFLNRGVPLLTGLSATWLYREMREHSDGREDDVAGDPSGHFVVLTGYDTAVRAIRVTDPMHPNPLSPVHTYPVATTRLIGAIYLGVLTYDANLLAIEPLARTSKTSKKTKRSKRAQQ